MFFKKLLLPCLLSLSLAATAQKKPFFYELISNDNKTINFVFGFYPSSLTYIESKEVESYTSIKSAVINKANDSLEWKDYKVIVLLKSGRLISSYITVAETGDYDCTYTVPGSVTHYQYYCFHTKFAEDDIARVWLVMGDDQLFSLLFDKNE